MPDSSDATAACESQAGQAGGHPVMPCTGDIWLNGRMVPAAEAQVSVFDHGLLYGDGCFEGIRVYNRRIFKLRSHLERMFQSSRKIYLEPRWTLEEIEDAVRLTVSANDITDGYVRLVFTRGVGTLGLNPFHCQHHTAFVIAADISLYPQELYEEGMPIVVAARRRSSPRCLRCSS